MIRGETAVALSLRVVQVILLTLMQLLQPRIRLRVVEKEKSNLLVHKRAEINQANQYLSLGVRVD